MLDQGKLDGKCMSWFWSKVMVRLVALMMMACWMTGCTQAQRFELEKNVALDECAMKRMTETKISGEQGYLQAHHECHRIVMVQKFRELNNDRNSGYGKHPVKDPLEEYELCWEFVKGLYIDENFPEMRIPNLVDQARRAVRDPNHFTDIWVEAEEQKLIEARNGKLNIFPNRLNEISTEKLIDLYELMATNSIIGHKTLCSLWRYHELESMFGREIKRR